MEWLKRMLRGESPTMRKDANAAADRQWIDVMKAVETGDLGALRIAFDRDPGLLHFSQNDWSTFLHYAAWLGRLDSAQYLISAGSDVNARDRQDLETPIFKTIQSNHLELMDLLIRHGALVNVGDRLRHTPMHAAIFHSREAMVKLLISNGADVHIEEEKGRNSIKYAYDLGRRELAAYLQERAETGYARVRLTATFAMLAKTVGQGLGYPVSRISVSFDDGGQLNGVSVVEGDAVLLPIEHQHRRISKVTVPKDQF